MEFFFALFTITKKKKKKRRQNERKENVLNNFVFIEYKKFIFFYFYNFYFNIYISKFTLKQAIKPTKYPCLLFAFAVIIAGALTFSVVLHKLLKIQ